MRRARKLALRIVGPASVAVVLLAASAPSASALDRTCDTAPYPSLAWTLCENQNFAKTGEAPAEQAANGDFVSRWQAQSEANIADWTTRATSDPSWLSPTSGNTPLLPLCASWGEQCTGDPFRYPQATGPDGAGFYDNEADVTPVVFYDRDCARLSGHVWVPRSARAGAKLPNIVFTNGSIQAPEPVYWFGVQALVRAGYVVLTFDPRGQGRSDQQSPDGQLGSNANLKVFWEGTVDAIDFLHSTPNRLYPHNQSCADTYPTPTTPFNPAWDRLDSSRLGTIGHSAGAISASVVQGYGAPGADPWPGLMDDSNPVKVAVAWDSLIGPNGEGFAPGENSLPPELAAQVLDLGSQGNLPKFGVRAPAMSFNADYGLTPTPYLTPPDRDLHKSPFRAWQSAGVPVYSLTFQGTTHFDYSQVPTFPATSWCPETASGACRGGWAAPAIVRYTVAWFDRWLKRANEPGYFDAVARLLDDAGPQGAAKMSFRYRSARDFPDRNGHRRRCEDIRAGCG